MIENNFVFLDSASTTRPKFFRSDYKELWFNSNMSYAYNEKQKLQEARERIKQCLRVKGGLILFLRNATDCVKWLSNHFGIDFCSSYEHSSVLNSTDFELPSGLYSHQYVNQMTGVVFPIETLIKSRDRGKGKYFVSDFTAAIGHINIPNKLESFCDAVWFSPHKFHTEKNIGVLWIGDRLCDLIEVSKSSNNQFNILHGTEDIAGALMVADAIEYACSNIEEKEAKWTMLADMIIKDFHNANIECSYIANNKKRTHAINALEFEKINAEVLINYLSNKNIFIGSGISACDIDKDYRVLNAFGLTNEEASHVVRISFDENTTIRDVATFIEQTVEFYKTFY